VTLYAAKIAAARLYAPKHELAAIEATIRAEERAALRVLREQEQTKAQRRRFNPLAWKLAVRPTVERQRSNANGPLRRRRGVKRGRPQSPSR
jgi:hypothetical protein